MRCPSCGTDESYTGLQWIHCKNEECRYYDARYAEQLRREKEGKKGSRYDEHIRDKVEKLILLKGEIGDSKNKNKRGP